MAYFCEIYNIGNLIRQLTCFNNPEKPSCFDLVLTNTRMYFLNACVIEIGLSALYSMNASQIKIHF